MNGLVGVWRRGSPGRGRAGANPSPRLGEGEYLQDLWILWTAKLLGRGVYGGSVDSKGVSRCVEKGVGRSLEGGLEGLWRGFWRVFGGGWQGRRGGVGEG